LKSPKIERTFQWDFPVSSDSFEILTVIESTNPQHPLPLSVTLDSVFLRKDQGPSSNKHIVKRIGRLEKDLNLASSLTDTLCRSLQKSEGTKQTTNGCRTKPVDGLLQRRLSPKTCRGREGSDSGAHDQGKGGEKGDGVGRAG